MLKIKEIDIEKAFNEKDKDVIIALERANTLDLEGSDCLSLDDLMCTLGITDEDLEEAENKHRDNAMNYNIALNQIGGLIEDQEEDGLTDKELISKIKKYVDWGLLGTPLDE